MVSDDGKSNSTELMRVYTLYETHFLTAPADVGGPATVAATLVMDEPDEPAAPAVKRARTQRGPNEGGGTPAADGPTGGGGGGLKKLSQLTARRAKQAKRERAQAGATAEGTADPPDAPPKKKGGRPQKGKCGGARQHAKKCALRDGGGTADRPGGGSGGRRPDGRNPG